MRILSLDYDPVYGHDATRASFSGDLSVFDHDITIWDPASSFRSYVISNGTRSRYRNLPSLSDDYSVQILGDATRRKAEFHEFVAMGRVLVIIARPPQMCAIDTGQRKYSGTGRNQKTTILVDEFDLLSAIPNEDNGLVESGGTRTAIEGDGPLSKLLRNYKKFIRYTAIISKPNGTVIAKVPGAGRAIATVQQDAGGGYLVLLPAFDFQKPRSDNDDEYEDGEDEEDEDEGWLPEAESFQYDLVSAIEQMTGSEGRSWPSWADRYLTSTQRHLRGEVSKQQKRVETARSKLTKLQGQSEESEAQNQLFLGSGRILELEVRKVLELLGGMVTEPEPGRDDWKVSFPEGDAVIEVKGVSKSAAEKHAAQLEKWVATALEETGKAPKGVLVVNTWRDLPLTRRTEEDFPSQMLPYSESRSHCLITGLQLLIVRNDIETNPERAAYWRREILGASGILHGTEDWQSVIQEIEQEARETDG